MHSQRHPASSSIDAEIRPSTSYISGILDPSIRRFWTPMILGIAACFGYLAQVCAVDGAEQCKALLSVNASPS